MKLTPDEFVRYLEDNKVFEDMAYDINAEFPEGCEAVQRVARAVVEHVARDYAVSIEVPE